MAKKSDSQAEPPISSAVPVPALNENHLGADDPQPDVSAISAQAPHPLNGLGGWLIVVGIGLLLAPILVLRNIFVVDGPALFKPAHAAYLSSHWGMAALVSFELLTNIICALFLVFLNVLFFRRKRSFPTFMIFFYLLQVGSQFIIHFTLKGIAPALSQGPAGLLRTVVAAAVWIPYFLLSERVKATFTR